MSNANAKPNELPALLTTEDVADALRVSVVHARRLCAAGKIPATRRGRRWYVPRDDFLAAFRPQGEARGDGSRR